MQQNMIVSKMNEYIHIATKELAKWLNSILPQIGDNWWTECVLDNLSYNQRERAINSEYSELDKFDLSALLRITNKSWYEMRSVVYLPQKDRECVREMFSVRNNWAHCSGLLPGKDVVLHDIDILYNFLGQLSVHQNVLSEIFTFKTEVENFKMDSPVKKDKNLTTNTSHSKNTDNIREKSMVCLISDPSIKGMVFSVTSIGNTYKYEVFVNGEIKIFFDGQIALVEDKPKYNCIDFETLQSYLTAYQINNPSINNLYSLNSARIDFVPYQFRPALKMIQSDSPRILIADSVGVGKTIEAGLIIKELEARYELENILIICPKPLVTEHKWELEMKRFDEEFITINGKDLKQSISDTDRDGEWPTRFSKAILPYSLLKEDILIGQSNKNKKITFGLFDLDPAPHFDLVIVDEAHHIRNSTTQAYAAVKYFCDHANAVALLTATPLQTGDNDLYTLLNVLRPDIVLDKETFDMMSKPNKYISKASRILRTPQEHWKENALIELQNILTTQWGENVISHNPIYKNIMECLYQREITREERVKLIYNVESLHSYNTMLNRTRRQDIQDFCIRRSHTVETEFTPQQEELHNELLRFEAAALGELHNVKTIPFMMSTIRRQTASCIFGLAPYIRSIIERRFAQIFDDPDIDMDEIDITGFNSHFLAGLASRILELSDNLPFEDPKFDSMLKIIVEKQQVDNNKIIIFSTFRHTLAYIKTKLKLKGYRVAQIDGSVKDEQRLAFRERFELPKNDTAAIDILLFTEVGCEGLDYQFCDIMINYDLPWNPMRIEQRIGRIDRRGQQSNVVNIYNLITANTVDADIYNRCLVRIGVFEDSIGECEDILGSISSKLEAIAIDSTLTQKERRYKLEQMADNEVRKIQEMHKLENEEKQLFGFDLSNYTVSKEIQRAENPWLSSKCLILLLQRYMNARLGSGNYIIGDSSLKLLRLSADARRTLLEDFRELSNVKSALKRKWEIYLKGGKPNCKITFDAETAEKNRDAFFITPVHPFIRQASAYFKMNEKAYINLVYHSDEIESGQYPFALYAWDYKGISPQFQLVAMCLNENVQTEIMDILQEACETTESISVNDDVWKELEKKNLEMWFYAKEKHKIVANATAKYRLESISNNFINRKRILEQQITDAYDANIIRMKQSELDNATVLYEEKVEKIEQGALKADIYIDLIVNGILNVKRG